MNSFRSEFLFKLKDFFFVDKSFRFIDPDSLFIFLVKLFELASVFSPPFVACSISSAAPVITPGNLGLRVVGS